MENSITLPYWLFIIITVFAAVMVLDRILLPGMRWYLRRRVNRVIEEINTRLDIEIRPFQLTRKQAIIDQLVFDDKVVAAIKQYAAERNMPREVAHAKAMRYATEIAPTFNAYVYFRFGYWLAKKIGRLIYRVRVGFFDNDGLKSIPQGAAVVFVMNHRSNMDYILVSFLVAEKTALSYAVGEWARIWPLQSLIKAMGAFFVRRNSGNPLYRKLLERYVNLATRAGVCQAVFIEGGLSKDGAMQKPRLGFLDYMLRDYHPDIDKDIVFVPVGINYDRVIEDKSLVRRLDENVVRRSTWFVLKTTLGFFFKTLFMKRSKRWSRFGYASVNFGQPVSTKAYCEANGTDFSNMEVEERFDNVGKLADTLTGEIKHVLPVLPIPLMSEIILSHRNEWKSDLEIKAAAIKRIDELEQAGAPIRMSANACDGVLTTALNMLVGRGFVLEDDNLFRANDEKIDLLSYYANSIQQWKSSE